MLEINVKESAKKRFRSVKIPPKILKVLKIVALLFLLYLVLGPFIPEIVFQVRNLLGITYKEEIIFSIDEDEVEDVDYLDEESFGLRESKMEDVYLDDNRLVIPTIGVHIGVFEGEDDSVLSKGAWRRPGTGTPATGGNTVITGHRFQYVPPNNRTFYNLDKLEIGSKVFVFWDGIEYVYEIYDKFVIEPHQTEIEKHMQGNTLTLYTCHPLWTADQRLVVRGKLLGSEE